MTLGLKLEHLGRQVDHAWVTGGIGACVAGVWFGAGLLLGASCLTLGTLMIAVGLATRFTRSPWIILAQVAVMLLGCVVLTIFCLEVGTFPLWVELSIAAPFVVTLAINALRWLGKYWVLRQQQGLKSTEETSA